MELEIRPKPTEEERAAIVEAVRRVLGEDPRAKIDPWWLGGLRDALGEGDERGAAAAP